MFIDEAIITVKGGRGGPGKIAFYANKSGPCGGDGGNGANVYALSSFNVKDLKKFISVVSFTAEGGQSGEVNRRKGRNGTDLFLTMPVGTTILDIQTKREIELNSVNPKVLLCRGGNGGLGNDALKTSTYQTPFKAETGEAGEKKQLKLILKLLADFGLIGLPNAGKSSLLNLLTAANVKTANYPFTTLEPNLGVFNGKIIADIPGLIEGASYGKGLGINFLKHIEKVRLILHCISSESTDIIKDYETVINEISNYNKHILDKKQIILLTKIDLATKPDLKDKRQLLQKYNTNIISISIYNETSLEQLKNALV